MRKITRAAEFLDAQNVPENDRLIFVFGDLMKETEMPLSKKGSKIMKNMEKTYGKKKGESVFYASKNKGKIKGVEKRKKK